MIIFRVEVKLRIQPPILFKVPKLIIALHDYYSLELELECPELVALGTS